MGDPPGRPGWVKRPFQRVWRDREGRENMVGPTGWPGMVGIPFRKQWEELGGLFEGLGWVDRHSRRSESVWEALLECRKGSRDPSGKP